MKKMLTLFLLCTCASAHGQQDPVYALYLNNPLVINPAYAGSNNMFNAAVQYRTQWAGLDANPTTLNFNSHMAFRENRMGAGLQIVQDNIGDTKNTEINALYAYKIDLQSMTLSFGMQAGIFRYENDPSSLNIRDSDDPVFASFSETTFNVGAGILLKSDRFMVGLSAPRMLAPETTLDDQSVQLYDRHYYLSAAYVFFLSEDLRLKPGTLVRATQHAPVSVDVSGLLTLRELYNVGLFTRNLKTYGALLQWNFKHYRFGYVFEMPGSASSGLNFNSHEFMLGISLGVLPLHDKGIHTF